MPPAPGGSADGVYVMLAPLSTGVHHIHFGGEINYPGGNPVAGGAVDFIENINYTISVQPR